MAPAEPLWPPAHNQRMVVTLTGRQFFLHNGDVDYVESYGVMLIRVMIACSMVGIYLGKPRVVEVHGELTAG